MPYIRALKSFFSNVDRSSLSDYDNLPSSKEPNRPGTVKFSTANMPVKLLFILCHSLHITMSESRKADFQCFGIFAGNKAKNT